MTHRTRILGTTLALAAAAMVVGAGTADAAKRQVRAKVAHRQAYHRYSAYDRRPQGYGGYGGYVGYGGYGAPYGAYPLSASRGPYGYYGTVDEAYGYPPGGIIARRTFENQNAPGLANELDYTVKQTATGGPVGGPLNSGSGR